MIFSTNLKGIMALLFGRHFFSKFVFCVTASNKLEHFFFGIPDWPAEVRRRAVHKTGREIDGRFRRVGDSRVCQIRTCSEGRSWLAVKGHGAGPTPWD